jgi:hypothetical protein
MDWQIVPRFGGIQRAVNIASSHKYAPDSFISDEFLLY